MLFFRHSFHISPAQNIFKCDNLYLHYLTIILFSATQNILDTNLIEYLKKDCMFLKQSIDDLNKAISINNQWMWYKELLHRLRQ